MFKLGGESGQL